MLLLHVTVSKICVATDVMEEGRGRGVCVCMRVSACVNACV